MTKSSKMFPLGNMLPSPSTFPLPRYGCCHRAIPEAPIVGSTSGLVGAAGQRAEDLPRHGLPDVPAHFVGRGEQDRIRGLM
jgi:hypothetical protein